jgi:hypothetical protein
MANEYDGNAQAIRVRQVDTTGGALTATNGLPVQSLSDPSGDIALVTPADGADISAGKTTRGLSLAGAGAISVVTASGQTVLIPSGALAVGMIHPIRITRVRATGTTATGMVAYF